MIHFYSQKSILTSIFKKSTYNTNYTTVFKKMEKHINNKKSRMNLLLIIFSMFYL